MEKLMYLLYKPSKQAAEDFRDGLLKTFKEIEALNASGLRLTIVDEDVAAAKKLYIRNTKPSPDGVISFWLNSAIYAHRKPIEEIFIALCDQIHGYLITESEPTINTQYPAKKNQRSYGMNQVVFLKKPETLSPNEWINIWHNSHTQIAIDTQSTFGYRQNVIARPLTENALKIDAIVEENFPPEAMTSAHAFYNAAGDDALLKKNQTAMFESVRRFVEFDKLDCLPMSEYNG